MKIFPAFYLLVAFVTLSMPVNACLSPRKDERVIDNLLEQWKAAVESASISNIMKLYDKNALMISTFAQDPLTTREQIADYYKKIVANPDIKVGIEDTHPRLFGDVAVNSGRYTISYTQEGESIVIPARFTFVYVMQDGQWKIVEQHSSRVPLPEKTN